MIVAGLRGLVSQQRGCLMFLEVSSKCHVNHWLGVSLVDGSVEATGSESLWPREGNGAGKCVVCFIPLTFACR